MRKLTNYILLITVAIVGISCASEASLQKYYIDSQDNENFISVDVPASIITLKDDVEPEVQEAYRSLKKMNVLAFTKNDTNEAEYAIEKGKVNKILKSKKFTELFRMKDKGKSVVVKYQGDDDSMDEVIIYAADAAQGFALVRILGDEMTAEKMMKLGQSIQDVDSNNIGLKQLEGFFKNKS
jgi:hypothetical protein